MAFRLLFPGANSDPLQGERHGRLIRTDAAGDFRRVFQPLDGFPKDQVRKLTGKLHDVAREALRDELDRLEHQLAELRERVTVLETERATQAAEGLESSF
jgi:hypothetical protein